MKYKILTAERQSTLEDIVNHLEGYKPQGGVCVSAYSFPRRGFEHGNEVMSYDNGFLYSQAMIEKIPYEEPKYDISDEINP